MTTATGQPPFRATSADVAREAGVSRSAVSQILNGKTERFTEETAARVHSAAHALGYRPSRAGRALATGLIDVAVLVVPNITFGRLLQDVVDEIATVSALRGLNVVVRYAGDDPQTTLNTILDLRPSAAIDLGVFDEGARARILEAGIPLLPPADVQTRMSGDVDHLIGHLQAERLVARDIDTYVYAMLEDRQRRDLLGPSRLHGFGDYLASHNIPTFKTVEVPLDRSGALAALAPVFGSGAGKVAVACYNDDVAIAIIAAARQHGLRVPDQVAVVGVDRTEIGQLVTPRLTTVDFDLRGLLGAILGDFTLPSRKEATDRGRIEIDDYVRLVDGESA